MVDTSNPWKTISTKITYENPWIRVREDAVKNPSGGDGIYGVVEFKRVAVAIIPVDEYGYTYIVGQYRYPTNTFEWEVPEGGSEFAEETIQTAIRELEEEVGLKAEHYEAFLEMQLSNSTTNEISISYLATGLKHTTSNPEETEKIHVQKIHLSELHKLVLDGTIKDALSVASILMLKEKFGNLFLKK